jgi:two-component system, OmpR family, phosphate regulon sensor histidine kinase PhoR
MQRAEDEIAALRAENARLRAQLAAQPKTATAPLNDALALDPFRQLLLATTSHELRASLNAIRDDAAMLQRMHDGATDAATRHLIEAIARQAEQGLRVIDGLTEHTQPHTPALRLRQRPLDLTPLLQHVVAQQQVQAKHHLLQLVLDGGPFVIQADADMIEQLLLNLLGNACKYSRLGTEVLVRLERRDMLNDVSVELAASEGHWAVISITDSGIGIAPDEHERVFDKFYRARNAAAFAPAGLGIGLYVCRLIAQRHGGALTLQSALGRGSVFTVYLPLL